MGFHEIRFPTDISYGSRGGPGFSTKITETDSGQEQRVARRSTPRHKFNAAYGLKSMTQLSTLRSFYNARLGCTYGFRYKDFADYCSTADGRLLADGGAADVTNVDQLIGTGDGTTLTFQLIKTYSDVAGATSRIIWKPVSGSVVVALAGVDQTSGWVVDTFSGLITFSSAPGVGVAITAGYQFDVPVRFGTELDEVLAVSIDDFSSGSVPDIPLVELLNPIQSPSELFYGGADIISFSATTSVVSLSATSARLQTLTATANGVILLPDFTDMPLGGPIFTFANVSSFSVTIKKYPGATIITTMGAASACSLYLGYDASGSKAWLVRN